MKKFLLILGVIVLGAIALNWGYFLDQLQYLAGSKEFNLPLTADVEYAEPDTIYIEKLGIKTPVIYVEERKEEAYQEAMTRGVGHFPGTATIGEKGNAYIFGHSSRAPWVNSDFNTIFSLIPKLEIGDEIQATDHEGRVYTYKVVRKIVVEPDNTAVLNQYEYEKKVLTLQTSWPLGMTLRRYVVVAESED